MGGYNSSINLYVWYFRYRMPKTDIAIKEFLILYYVGGRYINISLCSHSFRFSKPNRGY